MDYVKEIAELVQKHNESKNGTNGTQNELCIKEVCNELAFKREQVVHLKKELHEVNLKTFDLNRELENTKSLLKESEFNLKLALKKAASLEEKFNAMNESFVNLKMKEEMRLTEIQMLNDSIQKMAQENHQLSREAEELKDKLKYSRAFQDELESRQMKINEIITKTKESTGKLEKEHLKIEELGRKLQIAEEFKNLSQAVTERNNVLSKKNSELENKLTENIAKLETLEDLMNRRKEGNQQEKIIDKIKYLQWKVNYKSLCETNTTNQQIIARLTTALNEETETNAHLVLQNEEYESRIQELEKKLKNHVTIKEENDGIIEVE